MKNILAENMIRFGTKNINESDIKSRLTEALAPTSLTLNYDNGMLRFKQFFKDGDLVWDVNVIFKGSENTMTISGIRFVPGAKASADTATVVVPLLKPFSFQVPIDSAGGPSSNSAGWKTLANNWGAGIKLNLKSTEMAEVLAVTDPSKGNATTMTTLNVNIGNDILYALYFYCGAKGWYTGPKKDDVKTYAIFSNHAGESQTTW